MHSKIFLIYANPTCICKLNKMRHKTVSKLETRRKCNVDLPCSLLNIMYAYIFLATSLEIYIFYVLSLYFTHGRVGRTSGTYC